MCLCAYVPNLKEVSMKELIQFIQSVGFPIVIALLFYIDLRKVVNRNTNALDALAKQQAELTKILNRKGIK